MLNLNFSLQDQISPSSLSGPVYDSPPALAPAYQEIIISRVKYIYPAAFSSDGNRLVFIIEPVSAHNVRPIKDYTCL